MKQFGRKLVSVLLALVMLLTLLPATAVTSFASSDCDLYGHDWYVDEVRWTPGENEVVPYFYPDCSVFIGCRNCSNGEWVTGTYQSDTTLYGSACADYGVIQFTYRAEHEGQEFDVQGEFLLPLNPDLHEAVEHVPAAAPTGSSVGNIEYWHCVACDKYYSDESCIDEITQAETILPATGVALVTEGETVERYTDFAAAVSAWSAGSTLTLLQDVTIDATLTVPAGERTLDLNGCGLTMSGADCAISIPADATLDLQDSGSGTRYYTLNNHVGVLVDQSTYDAFEGTKGSFTGGYISGSSASAWGGIEVKGTLNMHGGTVIGFRGTSYNGGVFVKNNGVFHMDGGNVLGNHLDATYGAGVYVDNSGTFHLSGGVIRHNSTTSTSYLTAGGVNIHEGTFRVSGNPVVADNTNGSGAARNIYLYSGTIAVVGELTSGARLGVSQYDKTQPITDGYDTCNSGTRPTLFFFSDDDAYTVKLNASGEPCLVSTGGFSASITADGITEYYETIAEAVSAWTAGSTLTLLRDTEIDATLTVPAGERTLDLNGCGLTMSGADCAISIPADAALNLQDSGSGTRYYTLNNHVGVLVDESTYDAFEGTKGSFTGGYISTGSATSYGGIEVKGTLNMHGGTVIGFQGTSYNGGVFVKNNGVFHMDGGNVLGNHLDATYGAGVYVDNSGTFHLSGGVIRHNSTTSTSYLTAGGVNIHSGTLQVSGNPVVADNTNGSGAARNIYLYSGTIAVVGALTAGARIGVSKYDKTQPITDGYDAYNNGTRPTRFFFSDDGAYTVRLNANGEACLVSTGSFPVSVTANGITEYYDSIAEAVSDWTVGSTLTLLQDVAVEATVSVPTGMHTLDLNGHGLIAGGERNFCVLTVPSDAILALYDSDPDAAHRYSVDASGLAAVNDAATGTEGTDYFAFSGGYVTGANNSGNGGGAYVAGILTMYGGTILGNHAKGGSGIYLERGTFTMRDGVITGNTAGENGGGVYMYGGAMDLYAGTITRNRAAMGGGGIYTPGFGYPAALHLCGGAVTDNVCCGDNGDIGNGGGIQIVNATIYVSGDPVVTGNKRGTGDNATDNDVYLKTGVVIQVIGALDSGASIGVRLADGTGDFTSSVDTSRFSVRNFFSNNADYYIERNASGQLALYDGAATIQGSGTEADPYVIYSAAVWDAFAAAVNGGHDYAGEYVRLGADISVSTVVGVTGSDIKAFSGVFDGDGHTLNVTLSDSEHQGTAPFREISGATIKNLTVTGSSQGTTHTAGLVGFARGGTELAPNRIENCVVSTSVIGSLSGNYRHIGGVVGHGVTSYLTIKDTVFNGTMTTGGQYAGGLQGWSDGNHLTIENSFFVGSYSGGAAFHPIAIHNNGQSTTYTDNGAYYTQEPTLTDQGYIAGTGTMVEKNVPSFATTIDLPAADGNTYYIITGYAIHNAQDWDAFARSVSDGTDYAGWTVLLADDFDNSAEPVTTMAGTESHPFRGSFNGNGKTLYLNLETTEQYVAPFRYVENASFCLLHTAGTIRVSKKDAGGIISLANGTVSLTACRSSVDIISTVSGDGTHGGLVGASNNSLTFVNCLFDGSISGSSTTCCAGFVGWRNNTVVFKNCLMGGTMSTNSYDSATFSRNLGVTVENSYYRSSFGAVQGTEVGDMTNAGLAAALGSGWSVVGGEVLPLTNAKDVGSATVSGVDRYVKYTGNPITITPVVTAVDGAVLTEGTDYTVSCDPATVQDPGDYTLTFTGMGDYSDTHTVVFTVASEQPLTADTAVLMDGWIYRADTTLTNNHRLEVEGDAILILDDGVILTLPKGIHVNEVNNVPRSLTIRGEGKLIANADAQQAAIGSNNSDNLGIIIIEGGEIEATGGSCAAGIGGGRYSPKNGSITITGGKVEAHGQTQSAGIGGGTNDGWAGHYGSVGDITISGGEVIAYGSGRGAGIGGGGDQYGGDGGNVGTITITGGKVEAHGGSNGGYGIGPGKTTGTYDEGSVDALVLGWADADNDSIQANSFNASSISFESGKAFVLETEKVLATESNILSGGKLLPKTAAMRFDLSYAVVSGIDASYPYTGADIAISCSLTDLDGNLLTEATDYTVELKRGSDVVAAVNELGSYTCTFTGVDAAGFSGEKAATFEVVVQPAPEALTLSAGTAATAGFGWTEPGTATSWVFEYATDSGFTTDLQSVDVSGTPELRLTGLTPETAYYARVKSVIGSVESNWSETLSFTPSTTVWIGGDATGVDENLPFRARNDYGVTQQIYTAAEIGRTGTFTSLSFYLANGGTKDQSLDVYMVQTDKTGFDSDSDWIPVTAEDLVYSGSVSFGGSGYSTIRLDTPFTYDGTQNLAIIVDQNTGDWDGGIRYDFRTFATEGYTSLCVHDDSTNFDPTNLNVSGTRQQLKNAISLSVAYRVTVDSRLTGGTILPDKTLAAESETVTFTVTPDAGWDLGAVYYNDGTGNQVLTPDAGVYSFAMPVGDVTLTADFTEHGAAQIGGATYPTLGAALSAAVDDDTVVLLENIDMNGADVVFTKRVTLDLNGFTISNVKDFWSQGEYVGSDYVVADVTVTDCSDPPAGAVECSRVILTRGASMTITGGTFRPVDASQTLRLQPSVSDGLYANLTVAGTAVLDADVENTGGTQVTISGSAVVTGSMTGSNGYVLTGGYYSESPNAAWVADGYELLDPTQSDKAGCYQVVPHYVAQVGEAKYLFFSEAVTAANALTPAAVITLLDDAAYQMTSPDETLQVRRDGHMLAVTASDPTYWVDSDENEGVTTYTTVRYSAYVDLSGVRNYYVYFENAVAAAGTDNLICLLRDCVWGDDFDVAQSIYSYKMTGPTQTFRVNTNGFELDIREPDDTAEDEQWAVVYDPIPSANVIATRRGYTSQQLIVRAAKAAWQCIQSKRRYATLSDAVASGSNGAAFQALTAANGVAAGSTVTMTLDSDEKFILLCGTIGIFSGIVTNVANELRPTRHPLRFLLTLNGGTADAEFMTGEWNGDDGKIDTQITPTKTGNKFEGWYLDSSFSKAFDMTSKITTEVMDYCRDSADQYYDYDIDLYAKWDSYLCEVGGSYYDSFSEAVSHANTFSGANASVITLYKNAGSFQLSDGQTLKVRKNGNSLTVTAAEGLLLKTETEDDVTVYIAGSAVARVNDTCYLSFEDAAQAANGANILLLANIQTPYQLGANETVHVFLYGYTLTVNPPDGNYAIAETTTITMQQTLTTYQAVPAVAKVGDTLYGSFPEAVTAAAAASPAQKITLLANIAEPYIMKADETLMVIKDGHTLTVDPPAGNCVVSAVDTSETTGEGQSAVTITTTTYTVVSAVAKVGDTLYATFPEAVADAAGTQRITLLANIADPYTMAVDETLLVIRDGKTLTVNPPAGEYAISAVDTTETTGEAPDTVTVTYTTYTVIPAVASVNGAFYGTFTEAVAAAAATTPAARITLLRHIYDPYQMAVGQTMQVIKGNYDVTVNPPAGDYLVEAADSTETTGEGESAVTVSFTTYTAVHAVASVNGVLYASFPQAAAAAGQVQGGTVTLLENIEAAYMLSVGQTLLVNQGSFSLTVSAPAGNYFVVTGMIGETTSYTAVKGVATVNGTMYGSFPEAVTAAGGTAITLLENIVAAYTLAGGQTIRVILNGHLLNVNVPSENERLETSTEGNVTVYTAVPLCAQVGSTKYETFAAAASAANGVDEITLLRDMNTTFSMSGVSYEILRVVKNGHTAQISNYHSSKDVGNVTYYYKTEQASGCSGSGFAYVAGGISVAAGVAGIIYFGEGGGSGAATTAVLAEGASLAVEGGDIGEVTPENPQEQCIQRETEGNRTTYRNLKLTYINVDFGITIMDAASSVLPDAVNDIWADYNQNISSIVSIAPPVLEITSYADVRIIFPYPKGWVFPNIFVYLPEALNPGNHFVWFTEDGNAAWWGHPYVAKVVTEPLTISALWVPYEAAIVKENGDLEYYLAFNEAAADANGRVVNILHAPVQGYTLKKTSENPVIYETLKLNRGFYTGDCVSAPDGLPTGWSLRSWTYEDANHETITCYTVDTAHVVTFVYNNGTANTTQNVYNNQVCTKPTDPTRPGWGFRGWFTDSACTNLYAFTTAVTAPLTLYAGWQQTAVAKVGEVYYASFPEAVTAAAATTPAGTVTLLANIEAPYTMSVGQTIRVIRDGKTLTVNPPAGNYVVTQTETSETTGDPPNTVTIVTTTYAAVAAVASVDQTLYATLDEALSAAAGKTVVLLADLDTAAAVSIPTGEARTLDLSGHGIRLTASGSVITIPANAVLILTDSSQNVTHRYTVGADGLATVNDTLTDSYETFTGGYITGGNGTAQNANKTVGGGIYVNGGTLTLSHGTILGNKADSGAGVYVDGTGTFTMNGGAITGNAATVYAGGVLVNMNRTFRMSGGTISGNTAGSFAGGGIVLDTNSVLELSGNPTISGNTKGGAAENVYLVAGATIKVTGALSNQAPVGVTMQTPGVFTSSTDTTLNDAARFACDSENARMAQNSDGQLLLHLPITVAWLDHDGTVLETDEDVSYGTTPTYDGQTPTRAIDMATHTVYTFTGWSPAIAAVTADATYMAQYESYQYAGGEFSGHSLSLKGDIGVNFFVAESVDAANARVVLSWGSGQDAKTETHTFEGLTATDGAYRFTAGVAAKQMNDTVTAILYVNDTVVDVSEYSVAQYAYRILANAGGEFNDLFTGENAAEKLTNLQNLCRAMLIYGAKAQLQFNYNTDHLVDAELDAYTLALVDTATLGSYGSADLTHFGLRFTSSCLVLESKTSHKLYFDVTNADALADTTITCGSQTLERGTDANGFYVIIPNMAARNVLKNYTVTFTHKDGTVAKLRVNAGAYISLVLDDSQDVGLMPEERSVLKTTVTALYGYSTAAEAYFGS